MHTYKDIILGDVKQLRPSSNCTLHLPEDYEALQKSKWYAAYNIHFLMEFDDGIKWLIRVRQNQGHRLPSQITEPGIQSEVATLQVLRDYGIPVPEAYLPGYMRVKGERNETTLDYFFLSFMEGTPMDIPRSGHLGEITLPDDQLQHFIEEYAKTEIQLRNLRLPFTKIGCIYPAEHDGMLVGPIVSRGSFMNPTPPYFMGPFDTLKDMYLAKIDSALRYISLNALQGQNPVDAYLWHLELRELVSHSKVLCEVPDDLFIKHDDKKGDEMMVDSEGKVIGVIDWEWAYVTTKSDAFSTPWLFNRTLAYVREGSNSLTHPEELLVQQYEKMGYSDLADCVRDGRLYLRLDRIGYYDSAYKKSGFREVFGDDVPSDFTPPEHDVDWRVFSMKRYQKDEGLKEVMNRFGWTLERAEEEAERMH
ncbi:uncharacterized protein L199_003376 [Kwoniella botswanensis]|uniref:uncharacterized protein n=1 Tax=Kwoniella botswanensis TaxID=1268659 RepID=UPI00315CF4AB